MKTLTTHRYTHTIKGIHLLLPHHASHDQRAHSTKGRPISFAYCRSFNESMYVRNVCLFIIL